MEAPQLDWTHAPTRFKLCQQYMKHFFPREFVLRWLELTVGSPLGRIVSISAGDIFKEQAISDEKDTKCFDGTHELDKIHLGHYHQLMTQTAEDKEPVLRPLRDVVSPDSKDRARELVLDLDLNDMTSRLCCQGNAYCATCLEVATAGLAFILDALEMDMGLTQVLTTWSGRRGFHIIVHANHCSFFRAHGRHDQFSAIHTKIFNYLQFMRHRDGGFTTLDSRITCHPFIQTAYEYFEPLFQRIFVEQQGLLRIPAQQTVITRIIQYFLRKWQPLRARSKNDQPLNVLDALNWDQLKTDIMQTNSAPEPARLGAIYSIVFHYTYPRFDKQVANPAHKFACPFSPHPSSVYLNTPIPRAFLTRFRPQQHAVHTVNLLNHGRPDHNFTRALQAFQYFLSTLDTTHAYDF